MYIKTTGIGKSIFLSFLKRFLIFSLAIIISFNTVCKPKETKAFALTLGTIATVVACVSGVVWTADMIIGWFSDNKQMDEPERIDYFSENMSVDGDGNYIFSDDAQLTINQMLSDYNDSVTMVYRYTANPNYVDASAFKTKQGYDEFVRVLKDNPDKFFCHIGSYDESFGRTHYFLVFDTLESAISLYPDLLSSRCQFYDENWNTPLGAYSIGLIDETRDDDKMWCYTNTGNGVNLNVSFDDIFSASDLGGRSIADGVLNSINDFSCGLNKNTIYSAYAGAINTYKSLDDMKKDIGSQVIGNYIPDCYTGTPNYNITTSEVNNIVNNYYGGGSGDGSGDGSGSDDSGGSGIIDGLGKFFGAIGNIIDKLFGFVLGLLSKVVDFFASILEMFTDTLTKLIDIVPAGFNQFLSAMFPYIPEEWITIAEFILLVSAIGCVVALFK